MDVKTALAFSLPFALGLAAFGCALALGKAISAAMEAIARQPEKTGSIQTLMLIGAAFIEALTIYVLLVVFLLMDKLN